MLIRGHVRKLVAVLSVLGSGVLGSAAAQTTPEPPKAKYWAYVGAESADMIYRIRFDASGAAVEKAIGIGELAAEMEGPHGLAISKDGKYLHMTTGHGFPDGKYWKYVLGPDTLAGPGILLGNFPASIDISPDGLYAIAANFNLHGDMVPSSQSVIYTPTATEVKRVITCTMPHGSRIDPTGKFQYSGCMMDDQLVEIDTRAFKVSRRFSLAKGKEGPLPADDRGEMAAHLAKPVQNPNKPEVDPADVGHGDMRMKMTPNTCSPTWAQPSTTGARIYVACNKSDEIIEVDRDTWKVSRRITTGRGVYNLAVTPDGKLLVATLKQGNAVEVYNLESGTSVAKIPTSNKLAHGVTISSDSKYAFVSSEGIGAEPGKVDVIDLVAMAKVGTADVGQQASGIAFWKLEPK
jgi:DNA-binding beta-propeller fold protein YncE